MVRARLYMICGNCGCNDEFEYRTLDELVDDEGNLSNSVLVRVTCKNCSTIHSLEDNAKERDR